jgi:hypothetical protein
MELLGDTPFDTVLFGDGVQPKGPSVITDGPLVQPKSRPHRSVKARNAVIQEVEARWNHFDYMIMTDLDGVCGGSDPSLTHEVRVSKCFLE